MSNLPTDFTRTLAIAAGLMLAFAAQAADKIDPRVRALMNAKSQTDIAVLISPVDNAKSRTDIRELSARTAPAQRPQVIYDALRREADTSQRDLRKWLRRQGVSFRAFTVVNAIAATLPPSKLDALARRRDVAHIDHDTRFKQQMPGESIAKDACAANNGLPWGVLKINADDVWTTHAVRGAGVVVAGADTGYAWQHSALKPQYRGWDGVNADHNYNWHDAIEVNDPRNIGANPCGYNSVVPCDDQTHGTHTMGTMVGSNRVDRFVGVAPDAKWIGCRNMERGWGKASTYLECWDWFLAPTDSLDSNADPTKSPHIINNSWGCPPPTDSEPEDCTDTTLASFAVAVSNLNSAGILVIASAGNRGNSGCGSVSNPPAIYADALTVGSTGTTDLISYFSSRGPVTRDGSGRLKPDVSAPGESVCSTVPANTFEPKQGTSMAGPHVAGLAALVMSAVPALKRDPDRVREFIMASALPLTSAQTCGAFPGSVSPNAVFGYGRVDALAAVNAALAWQALQIYRNGFEDVVE